MCEGGVNLEQVRAGIKQNLFWDLPYVNLPVTDVSGKLRVSL